jgi:hypothetical protein
VLEILRICPPPSRNEPSISIRSKGEIILFNLSLYRISET